MVRSLTTGLRKYVVIFSIAVLSLLAFLISADVYSTVMTTVAASLRVRDKISQLRGMSMYTTNKKTGATSVLILTYMRSGSSLTGDILQQATESFFVYEPLRKLQNNANNYPITYLNGSKGSVPFDMEKEKVRVIYNWFTCDVGKLPTSGFTDGFMKFGKKTKEMFDCVRKRRNDPGENMLRICGEELRSSCLNSPIRIIKTIRMELESVSHMLDLLPNLKIVHLVRDPRATLFSQSKLGRCRPSLGGIQECVNEFCKRLENDVLEEERLQKRYPNRIMPVFYEDIARYPLETSRKMFQFIGTEFTNYAKEYIFNITMAGKNDTCVICTTRSNSTEHIDTWKKDMKPEFINVVQSRCNYILRRYQFVPINT